MKTLNTFLFFSIIFLFLSVGSISAYTSLVYGNRYFNSQTFFQNNYGEFNLGTIVNSSINFGYDSVNSGAKYQPIVEIRNGVEYVFFPYGSYIDVYDSNLILMEEFNTGTCVSQIELIDFDLDDSIDELAGVYMYNSTLLSYKVLKFNFTSNAFSKIYEYNVSVGADFNVSGVRLGRFIVTHSLLSSKYRNDFYYINNYSVVSFNLPNLSTRPLEPVDTKDVDSDGTLENVFYTSSTIFVFTDSGSILMNRNFSSGTIQQALFFSPDSSSIKKLAVIDGVGIHVYRATDGSYVWENNLSSSGGNRFSRIGIDTNYGGFTSIHYVSTTQSTNLRQTYIFRGVDGTIQANVNLTHTFRPNSMWLADMNHDGYADMIVSNNTDYYIYSVSGDTFIKNLTSLGFSSYSCIPVDFTLDGKLDLMCSGQARTIIYSNNLVNNNSEIVSLAFDPSTSFVVGSTLYVTTTATDPESDTIYYSYRCNSSNPYSVSQVSNIASCTYDYVGTYEFSVRVRDGFHIDYDTYSQNIIVTSTALSCNNDYVCDSGENSVNCPNDCPIQNQTIQSQYGGATLPTELVNVDNENEGLLPEIYMGTLAFFSSSAIPLMIIIFTFLIVMIIFGIFMFIMKVVKGFT